MHGQYDVYSYLLTHLEHFLSFNLIIIFLIIDSAIEDMVGLSDYKIVQLLLLELNQEGFHPCKPHGLYWARLWEHRCNTVPSTRSVAFKIQ